MAFGPMALGRLTESRGQPKNSFYSRLVLTSRHRGSDPRFGRPTTSSSRFTGNAEVERPYSPAMVIPSIRSVGEATDPRNSRSLPMAVMLSS